jgi:hypothetical protein
MVKASNALLYCRAKSYNGQKVHEENGKSGQYALKCCKSELCNNGTDWPQLPDVPTVGKNLLKIFSLNMFAR